MTATANSSFIGQEYLRLYPHFENVGPFLRELVTACHPVSSVPCQNMTSDFTSAYDHTATIIPALLQAVPH